MPHPTPLPPLPEELTAEAAREAGIGLRQLARLRSAGLAVRTPEGHRLVPPVQHAVLALAAIGPPAALCGPSAARRYGWLEEGWLAKGSGGSDSTDPVPDVHVLVPRDRCPRPWPGAVVHRAECEPRDLVTVEEVRLTGPVRTALDTAGSLDLVEALPMLDRLLRDEILDLDQLMDALADRCRWPGCARAATALSLADARHASHPESVFRALVHRAGLPAPVPQYVVRLDGAFVGRADFAWPAFRLLAEIDGFEFHKEYGMFVKDRRRLRKANAAGWYVLQFAASEVLDKPDEVIADVRRGLALAAVGR